MMLYIFGDSFAVNRDGWVGSLGRDVRIFSQNGVGEYKIYKQVIKNLKFDQAIICHTSPWRVHTRMHPIHKNNPIRNNNDFLLNDVEYHSKINKDMKVVNEYLKNYYDPEYQEDTYNLFLKQLMKIPNITHITFHEPEDTKQITNNFNAIYKKHPGDINHMSEDGNLLTAERIKKLI
jgi:hypothetical protein